MNTMARQADPVLDGLLATLLGGRREMEADRHLPPQKERRSAVQHRLLAALESYTSALTARGLSAPPRLRDELALQRRLSVQPASRYRPHTSIPPALTSNAMSEYRQHPGART
jgi:hypothetical protein